ncbi:MAG: DUF169 domain-containing protein [Methanomicrobiaceae archaeon]|nr:DUF169 domain-containing protein [Methanomicrobiaceae archaeon]
MDISLRDRFFTLWEKYFYGAELPITMEFRDGPGDYEIVPPPKGWRCLICQFAKARNGAPLAFNKDSVTCMGGLRYSGYSHQLPPHFRYFLSSGKEGIIEGERYKKTPEIVDEWEKLIPKHPPHKNYLHVKRWDKLTEKDNPEVVVFFARPEVMSGLFTLANFDQSIPNGVICPMGSGCSSILLYPWLEQQKDDPKVILGMFDPSARKCVPIDVLTMAFPMKKFEKVIGYMEESFLITNTWATVQKKIKRSAELNLKS